VVIPTTLPRRKDGGIIKYMENNWRCVALMDELRKRFCVAVFLLVRGRGVG
jgi:hypothetical protein